MKGNTMKKLALALTAATIALTPFVAEAKDYSKNYPEKRYQRQVTRDADGTIRERTRTVAVKEVQNVDGFYTPVTLALRDSNEKIHLDGEKIYLVTEGGYKFFAPDGHYTTRDGLTFFSEKGLITHTEGPTEIVYVDADLDDGDGVTVTKRTARNVR